MPEEGSKRLLIVDDDPELLKLLNCELSEAGYHCICCNNGNDALISWRQETFDLVVLDWMLPDFTGLELCQRLRRSGDITPVLMLTARDAIDERVKALDVGVDDYLAKPFNLKELHARVRAQLRRNDYVQTSKKDTSGLHLAELKIDPLTRCVQRGERVIETSQREFELLQFLLKNAGEVQQRQTILDAIWGKPFYGDPNILDVYMGYLRKKVEEEGKAQLLHTVRGVGFIARVGELKS